MGSVYGFGLQVWFTGLVYGLYQTCKPNPQTKPAKSCHGHVMVVHGADGKHGFAGLVYDLRQARKPNPRLVVSWSFHGHDMSMTMAMTCPRMTMAMTCNGHRHSLLN